MGLGARPTPDADEPQQPSLTQRLPARLHRDPCARGPRPSEGILSATTPDPQSAGPPAHHSPQARTPRSQSMRRRSHPNATAPRSVAAAPGAAMLASSCSSRRGAELRKASPNRKPAKRGRNHGRGRSQSQAVLQARRRERGRGWAGSARSLAASLKGVFPGAKGQRTGCVVSVLQEDCSLVPRFLVEHTSSPRGQESKLCGVKY